MVFDCLHARTRDLRDRPLYVRRNVVEDVLDGQDVLLPVSPYVGGRTLKWLKVKVPNYSKGQRGWEPSRRGGPARP